MRVAVAGGTGFIGRALCAELVNAGHAVLVLTRDVEIAGPALGDYVETVEWNAQPGGAWMSSIDGADAVVNLAGESIGDKRWTPARKQSIIGSRLAATNALVEAISGAKRKPSVMVSSSAVGYYGPRGDEIITEADSSGNDFLAQTTKQWEEAARKVEKHGVRLVILRNGVVLERDGGALEKFLTPFRFFAGGTLGSGRQWFSWIHRDDVIGLMKFALENRSIKGVMNATAPVPVTMKDFCSILGRVMGRPSWAPVPDLALKIVLGELSQMILTGQRVVPAAAEKAGYKFKYRNAEEALAAILRR
jgi:hypothetical protein